MKESYYQTKIINWIEGLGGHVVNGTYTRAGEADLQCGIPIDTRLLHIAIEVKTPKDYDRVISCINENYDIMDEGKLKKHEYLQMTKIRILREKGGLALVASNASQIQDYILDELDYHI